MYAHQEVLNFAEVFFKSKHTKQDHAKLNSYLDPAVDRYRQEEEEAQDDFKGTLNAFLRVYAFLSQITPFSDADLEMHYAFGRMLARKLAKKGDEDEEVNLDEDVALQYYRIQKVEEGSIDLEGGGTVSGPKEVGTGKQQELEIELSRLIDLINQRLGRDDFSPDDQLFLDQTVQRGTNDPKLREWAMANDNVDNFLLVATDKVEDTMLDSHDANADLINRVFAKPAVAKAVLEELAKQMYRQIREEEEL